MVTLPGGYSEGERSLHSTRPRVLCHSRSVLLPSPRAPSAYRIYALLVHGHLAHNVLYSRTFALAVCKPSCEYPPYSVQHTTHTWHTIAHLTRTSHLCHMRSPFVLTANVRPPCEHRSFEQMRRDKHRFAANAATIHCRAPTAKLAMRAACFRCRTRACVSNSVLLSQARAARRPA